MKNLFYGILSFYLIGFTLMGFNIDRKTNLDDRNGGIILHKSDGWLLGNTVYIQLNDTIYTDYVYHIAIKDLEVGDTIKVKNKYY